MKEKAAVVPAGSMAATLDVLNVKGPLKRQRTVASSSFFFFIPSWETCRTERDLFIYFFSRSHAKSFFICLFFEQNYTQNMSVINSWVLNLWRCTHLFVFHISVRMSYMYYLFKQMPWSLQILLFVWRVRFWGAETKSPKEHKLIHMVRLGHECLKWILNGRWRLWARSWPSYTSGGK